MCLAIPGRVVSIEGDFAKVDFGLGVIRQAIVSLVDVKVGEYVLVHAGYAIQVMNEIEAEQTLKEWSALLEAEQKIGVKE
jgi:hydrogenase expression/formation protein HypC